MWHKHKDIVHYEKFNGIPGSITMLPTADYNIYVFELQLKSTTKIFSFNYYETLLVYLKYEVSNSIIKLDLLIEEGQECEDFLDDRCIIWLDSNEKIESSDIKPIVNKKYSISKGCEISIEKKIDKNVCLGFYNGPYY